MLWWLSSARSRRRVWLRLSARCLKSKTSSLIYLDNNIVLSDAEAVKMDRSAAADILCGCASIHFQSFGITQRHIVV